MLVATPDPDPFELWCRDKGIDEADQNEAFVQYLETTTGWNGQTFSLSEDERHWITRANEIVEWLRLVDLREPDGPALRAALRCLASLKPIPGSLQIE